MRALRPLLLGALAAAALPLAAALAVPSKTIVLADPAGDVAGPLDVKRASLGLGSDGRLRIAVTFAGKIAPKDLLAPSGPPGSVCARVWTDPDADPKAMRPDKLVCVTVDQDAKLRAGIYAQPDSGLLRHPARVAVRASKSRRSIIVRVAQSALGRPRLIRIAVESTAAGCDRIACVDNAPDGGAVRRLRLR
jgi:hypothetical protein